MPQQLLFSYGTLQLKQVQLASFGRELQGSREVLTGYRLAELEIRDPEVLAKSAQAVHPIAVKTDNPHDRIEGMLFQLTDAELVQADAYEVADYQRVVVTFQSGQTGWAYVAATP